LYSVSILAKVKSTVAALVDVQLHCSLMTGRKILHMLSPLQGTPCDLVTGEERKYAQANGEPSSHVSCTVEMTCINVPCM